MSAQCRRFRPGATRRLFCRAELGLSGGLDAARSPAQADEADPSGIGRCFARAEFGEMNVSEESGF